MSRGRLFCAGAVLLAAGCEIADPPAPDRERFLNLAIVAGNEQVGLPGSILADSVTIRLFDRVTQEAVTNWRVSIRAPAGSGIEVSPTEGRTDASGLFKAQIRLGTDLGRYLVLVNFEGNRGNATNLAVEASNPPHIAQLTPNAGVRADDEIVITGQNFGIHPEWNDVRIDNVRAQVLEASSTRLRARVPRCLPSRATKLTVRRGVLQSTASTLNVVETAGPVIDLERGQAVSIRETANLSCLRIAARPDSADYIVVALNAALEGRSSSAFQLVGLTDNRMATQQQQRFLTPGTTDTRIRFESALRRFEAELLSRVQVRPPVTEQALARVAVPEVGDRRDFHVLTPAMTYQTVEAVARAVGQHVVLYVDPEVGSSMTSEDVGALVRAFDDPIFPTDIAVFGDPPDLDRNGRIAVLVTPVVNRMTGANETSFIAGFFFSCDLISSPDCPRTNTGEVLYAMTPDPEGRFGLVHPRERVLDILPAILAHEFQHLIHFNQRILVGGLRTPEAVWLSEALAHSAEDTVAGVLRARGRVAEALAMESENYRRAALFLRVPEATSLVNVHDLGTVEERGAGWLMLKYLRARVGGDILKRLTRATGTGTQNVVATSSTAWATLLRDWATALYAAGAPELAGLETPAVRTFGPFDLRAAIRSVTTASDFPLVPRSPSSSDFLLDFVLPASAASYLRYSARPGEQLNLTLGGDQGHPITSEASPEIAILRVR